MRWKWNRAMAKARRTDPSTSHDAARKVERAGKAENNRTKCFEALLRLGGQTSAEVAVMAGLDRHEAARRLPELRDANQVRNGDKRRCSITNNMALTWWVVTPSKVGQETLFR